jgi:NAD(P)-dependent dehydrogenase (short-subunit alcohol dehydrogenase family)
MGKELTPFGINTLLVEPGYFRTHFLGNKETFNRRTSSPYKTGPVQDAFNFLLKYDNKQPGDPDKAAERIFELVTDSGMAKGKTLTWGQGGFQRTPLGKDAAEPLKAKGEEFIKTAETYMELACATAHDD